VTSNASGLFTRKLAAYSECTGYEVRGETDYRNRVFVVVFVEVKGSRNRPGVAQRAPGGLVSQISMTFGT
jgi:hypothetical protein